jgi:alanine-glyoxylate transaminase/serine-glyoxylate transaminase/serine-pyruvate transaminase
MDELQQGLRELFQTKNEICFAVSGTGSSGMETLAVNLIEKNDVVIVGINGVFGGRIKEMCEKLGAKVIPIEVPFGSGINSSMIEETIQKKVPNHKIDAVWVVHAETSTGYLITDLKEMADITHKYGGIFMIDTVTGLGGNKLLIDEWGIDAAFSGTQKCLGVPPCLSPVTLGPRALEKFQKRKTVVPSWYFDIGKLLSYWQKKEGKRAYHHTAPISSVYSLYEGVRNILEETLPVVQKRYSLASEELKKGLESRGFQYVVKDINNRLPNLHCVYPPENIDETLLRKYLLNTYGVEIGAGLGSLAGKAIRVGLMGINANIEVVQQFFVYLDDALIHSKKKE